MATNVRDTMPPGWPDGALASSVEYQQQRGVAWDIIEQAINTNAIGEELMAGAIDLKDRNSRRWFEQQRLDWILETIRVFGFINRVHIERKFGISTPQASSDLREFQQCYPDAITYNKCSKRYERKEGLAARKSV